MTNLSPASLQLRIILVNKAINKVCVLQTSQYPLTIHSI
jgi:hypothetical protein